MIDLLSLYLKQMKTMNRIEMTAVFEPCEEGGFIAYVQEISGINTQGETLAKAKANLAEAVNLVFEEMM
jgi:predicted RNase H-like HicB family nuclease